MSSMNRVGDLHPAGPKMLDLVAAIDSPRIPLRRSPRRNPTQGRVKAGTQTDYSVRAPVNRTSRPRVQVNRSVSQ
ncbi:hypothetical protein RIF29_19584 [Crotalaria pallida]|uniref:Uncharacterized protein n=1 Tax=Crotalaria pallida TaxID=3830 RepID=A0AAN9F3S8_CROPI